MDKVENATFTVAQNIPDWQVDQPTQPRIKVQVLPTLGTEADVQTGQDLSGNTYWEFRDQLRAGRWRRMVRAGPLTKGKHYSDVEVSPQWHQWLRHARPSPPTIQDQQTDLIRQAQLKHNAMLADERWAAKAKYIEKPKPQPRPMLASDVRVSAGKETIEGDDSPGAKKPTTAKDAIEDPWEKAKERGANPGGAYQPEAWTPGNARKR